MVTTVQAASPANPESPSILNGMSLNELSRRTGISRPHIANIFNRKRKPSFSVAQQIATTLGVSLDALWNHLEPLE